MTRLSDDLAYIADETRLLWDAFRDGNIFISGGTGFFGCWLLESFVWANRLFGLNARATVLTRNPKALQKRAAHLLHCPEIEFICGDVRDFAFPAGTYRHVIHAAATSAVETFNKEDPLRKFSTVIDGTRRMLDFALQAGAEKFLYTSSGAVYGPQPATTQYLDEDYGGAPDPLRVASAWGESKRAAELLCTCYADCYGLKTTIARCFSFSGPYLQLDVHYAFGNFVRDGMAGGPIRVNGDGSPVRSYLYAADLTVWLWTILVHGKSGRAYNVGSENGITIAELARKVGACFSPEVDVVIAGGEAGNASRYVPSTRLAREDLGLREKIGLREAILRTIAFYRAPC